LSVPAHPSLWVKPAAALASPLEDIPMNAFCSSSLPDYEGELVFVVSKECRDLTPKEAASYILGYTIGNDVSCRLHQIKEQQGGQFFFAKAFDKFAPIGPILISPEVYANGDGIRLITRVNGQVLQNAESTDMIWSAAEILSHMSQGKSRPNFQQSPRFRVFIRFVPRNNNPRWYGSHDRDTQRSWGFLYPKALAEAWGYCRD
jgi:2-keto-4-pentenoate hydratase/2-oxohepta-3-ene-1,7-dioic acid hydratase in catechol pathway